MQRIPALVQDRSETIVSLCQDLVRINTVNPYSGDAVPGGERAGQEFLEPILRSLGAQTTLFDCPDDIYQRTGILGPKNRVFRNRPNLVGTFDFGGNGPTIVLNGHMDTVSVDGMKDDPFGAVVRDGRIYSRGTSDCKGGLSTAVSAVRLLLELGLPLRGKIILQSVVDEECNGGGAGTLACLDAGYTGDVAVFVDGNDSHVTLGCGGCLTADVFVEGKEGHAALGNGVSAIDKGVFIKQVVDEFKQRREAEWPDCLVNLGIFHAGIHPAVIPGSARLSLNTVYDVSEAQEAKSQEGAYGGGPIRRLFEQMISDACGRDEWLADHPARVEWVKDLIPYTQPQADPWVSRFTAAFTQARDQAPVFDRMTAWSDAAHPVALWGIPTLLYGPGVEGVAHASVEYVEISNLLNCTAVLTTFLAQELGPTNN